MSGFEYFSIAVSVILSFSAIRLLDALQHIFSPPRRYWPHALWVIVALAWHVHFWWIFWGYVRVEVWTYLRFVLVLVPPGLLYALVGTLVTRSPGDVESWHDHFGRCRVQFFTLLSLWIVALGLAGWVVLEIPLTRPLRVLQLAALAGYLAGAASPNARLHAVLPILNLVGLLLIGLVLTFRPLSLA